jgi:hypothetical protein
MPIPAFASIEGNCEVVSGWSHERFGCKFRKERATLSITWRTYDPSLDYWFPLHWGAVAPVGCSSNMTTGSRWIISTVRIDS